MKSLRIAALSGVLVLALAGVAQAKSFNVHIVGHGSETGVALKSTYVGTPFGTCHMTGTLVIPNTNQTWKCAKGSFKLVGVGTTGASNNSAGTWSIVKGSGTGTYKKLSGSGKFTGMLSTGVYT